MNMLGITANVAQPNLGKGQLTEYRRSTFETSYTTMKKIIHFLIFSLLVTFGYQASSNDGDIGLSTSTYQIQITDNCKNDEERCIKVKFTIYEKATKKVTYATGEGEWSSYLQDDGTYSSPKIQGYKIKLEQEQWYISIPSGNLTKYDNKHKELSSEPGEWIN